MLKRKLPNEYHQMLPQYVGEYEPRRINIDFESTKESLMAADNKMLVQRRSERIFNVAMDCKSYTKNEDISENKDIFVHGFKHVKTDEVDKNIIIGCESDVLYKNDKLINFWSNSL